MRTQISHEALRASEILFALDWDYIKGKKSWNFAGPIFQAGKVLTERFN